MTPELVGPFFEIGPKNLMRRSEVEALAAVAGRAAAEHEVTVVVTVPTAMIAPIRDGDYGVLVFAQGMDRETAGPSMNRVTAESLVDAGAHGVMLNHDADPLTDEVLTALVGRARHHGLRTIVCASTCDEAMRAADLRPTVVLLEPAELIGTAGSGTRDWVGGSTQAIRGRAEDVLAMHAGGVATPAVAEALMAAGADGTGSTSGVVHAPDPLAAAQAFIAATRAGWDRAHP